MATMFADAMDNAPAHGVLIGDSLMGRLLKAVQTRSRRFHAFASVMIVTLVGLADFTSGYDISFSVFYVLAISEAVWFVGGGFGVFIAIASVATWLVGDIAAGANFKSTIVLSWNAAIMLASHLVVVWILWSLRKLHRQLEARVLERTQALREEIAERTRLEKELLGISEREQRRIGHDLHDSLCQHLTGTALAGEVLAEKLANKSAPEASDAAKVVDLVEDGISLARSLAHGLAPVELEAEGLVHALQEYAQAIAQRFGVVCTFECERTVLVPDPQVAIHLYRIAQESVGNAIEHGKSKHISIVISETQNEVRLSVRNDGEPLPPPEKRMHSGGMGLRIMAHRAAMIGGQFSIESVSGGGTVATCVFPSEAYSNGE